MLLPKCFHWQSSLIPLLATLLLAACVSKSTSLQSSTSPVAALQNISTLNLRYLDGNLLAKTTQNSPEYKAYQRFGYQDFERKLGVFGPLYLKKNGLNKTTADKDSYQASSSHTLVLGFREGRLTTQGSVESIQLLLQAELLDPLTKIHVWTGRFRIVLGNDPGWGILKTTRVDKAFIEETLQLILLQMNKDGVLNLKKVAPPTP